MSNVEWDIIIFTRKFPLFSSFSPPNRKIPWSAFLKKSKYPDGQRDDLSLTEGMDLLSSQMFEILPPACIIERDVLIALMWQLVGLPRGTWKDLLILNHFKSQHCGHRKVRPLQPFLSGQASMQGLCELGLQALWQPARACQAAEAPG